MNRQHAELLLRYGLAVVLPLCTLVLRFYLDDWFGERPVLILFVLPIFISAYIGGLGPGLTATVATGIGVDYFLIPPRYSLTAANPVDFLQWGMLVFVGLLISLYLPRRTAVAMPDPAQRLSTERKVQGGFILGLACLLLIGTASYISVTRLDTYAERIRISAESLSTLRQLLSLTTDAETALRGYALTGNENYIQPYESARQNVEAVLDKLQQQLRNRPEQLADFDMLRSNVRQQMHDIGEGIEARRRTPGIDSATLHSDFGKQLQDRIRTKVADLEKAEQSTLEEHLVRARLARSTARVVIVLSSIAALLVVCSGLFVIGREFDSTRGAQAALQEALQATENRVLERTEDLARSNATAKESEARLAGIISSAMDAIISIDDKQNILLVNAAAEQMFGYTRAELLGQTLERLIPESYRASHAGKIAEFHEAEQSALRKRGPVYGLRASGQVFPVEASLSKTDVGGHTVYTVVLRDISERHAAEQGLREREHQLTQVTNLMTGPVSRLDRNGRYVFANAAYERWFGKLPDEVIGRTIGEVLGETLHKRLADFQARAQNGEEVHYEVAVNSPADGTLYAEASLIPQFDEDGRPSGYFVVYKDVTDRKNAEIEIQQLNADLERRVVLRTQELATANRELEAFSYSISHDLRAPLRAINGFARILLEDHGSQLTEDGRRYLELIHKSGVQMGELIDDLLSFSRLSRQPLKRRELQPAELVQQCLESLHEERRTRLVDIDIAALPACSGDPALLRQVWLNLLSNALKYTRLRSPARIEVGCKETVSEDGNKHAAYFVRDNGVGFDMRYSDKLFGVFHRLHRAEDYEGTGVGLAIAQRIIHRHGGRIWAQATPDEGACFYFTIGNEDA